MKRCLLNVSLIRWWTSSWKETALKTCRFIQCEATTTATSTTKKQKSIFHRNTQHGICRATTTRSPSTSVLKASNSLYCKLTHATLSVTVMPVRQNVRTPPSLAKPKNREIGSIMYLRSKRMIVLSFGKQPPCTIRPLASITQTLRCLRMTTFKNWDRTSMMSISTVTSICLTMLRSHWVMDKRKLMCSRAWWMKKLQNASRTSNSSH